VFQQIFDGVRRAKATHRMQMVDTPSGAPIGPFLNANGEGVKVVQELLRQSSRPRDGAGAVEETRTRGENKWFNCSPNAPGTIWDLS